LVEPCRRSAGRIGSLSGDSELREWEISAAGECAGSKRLNTLRVVGGRAWEACEKVSEGVRKSLAQEGQFLLDTVGEDPREGSSRKELWSGRILQGGESTVRIHRGESRNPADSQI
jgi:hypothetical protein